MSDTSQAVEALPKVDLHVHSESAARLERRDAAAHGRESYDWARWNRQLASLPTDTRLARLNGDLDVAFFEAIDLDDQYFLSRTVEALSEAAQKGAVLVELRFGQSTAYRRNLMPLFDQAQRIVRSTWPNFRAGALLSVWPDGEDDG